MDQLWRGGIASAVLPLPVAVRRERAEVAKSSGDAVRGDLEEVFRRDYPTVVGVARRVLGSPGEADDVAQDVFLSFARSAVPASEARGWLCVAAAHTALNVLRSGRRRTAREERAGATAGTPVADVAEVVLARADRDRARAALGRLPHKQAVVLVLRHSGFSYAEVAAALDLAPGSVGTTLRRAEVALRKEVEADGASD